VSILETAISHSDNVKKDLIQVTESFWLYHG